MTIAGEPCPNCDADVVDIIDTYIQGLYLRGYKCKCPNPACASVWVLHIA